MVARYFLIFPFYSLALTYVSSQRCHTDILFILDASSSVRGDFVQMTDYMQDVAQSLNIGPQKHRVAWLVYSGRSKKTPSFAFDEIQDNAEFLREVTKIPYLQGTTYTGRALKRAQALLLDRDPGRLTVVFVVTDGKAFDRDDVIAEAAKIRAMPNVQVFCAAVPASYDKLGMLDVAGNESHIIFPPNLVEKTAHILEPLISCRPEDTTTSTSTTTTTTTTLPPTTASFSRTFCEVDLLLVMDFSSSVDRVHETYINYAIRILDVLRVSADHTRLAMITYASAFNSKPVFHFNTYSDALTIMEAMRRAEYTGGTTATGTALNLAIDEFNDHSRGSRPEFARQIAIVFTDGFSQEDPGEAAANLRKLGVEVFSVGIVRGILKPNLVELELISGDSIGVYTSESFERLLNSLAELSSNCVR